MCKMMLKEGRGAAFSIDQGSGVLGPYSTELIEISAFSDMWGEYSDTVSFRVIMTYRVLFQ